MNPKWTGIFLLAFMLTGCNFQCSVGDKDSGTHTKKTAFGLGQPLYDAIVKNDIELDATGVKVSKAYLMNKDNVYMATNAAGLGEKVICTIELDTGWVKLHGNSFIGASEKIVGSDGTVVLNENDLFAAYDNQGLSATDARIINLTAIVTRKVVGVDDYFVEFRIWDKKGNGAVTGKYKFRVN